MLITHTFVIEASPKFYDEQSNNLRETPLIFKKGLHFGLRDFNSLFIFMYIISKSHRLPYITYLKLCDLLGLPSFVFIFPILELYNHLTLGQIFVY